MVNLDGAKVLHTCWWCWNGNKIEEEPSRSKLNKTNRGPDAARNAESLGKRLPDLT
jgi:hypothetical protein